MAMPALYRQYRPQRFEELFGQPHITGTLKAAIEKNRISHAFLFQGPRGTGKTTTARILAKRLNCTKAKDAEPCGSCASCKATAANKNIDIIEIDAASNRGIDNIRALRDNTSLSPAMSKYKVYIIDEVHMLSHDAFPALLKTLEEPVEHVVFILATTELHKVPQTILSRCQVYRFRRATNEEMRQRLDFLLQQEKREADETVLDFIISRSDGCYRDAESLLGQLLSAKKKKLTGEALTQLLGLPSPTLVSDFLTALMSNALVQALDIIDAIHTQGFDTEQFIHEAIRTARDGMVSASKGGEDVPAFASTPGAGAKVTQIIRALVQATNDLAYVPQPIIALQLAALTVCTAGQPVRTASPTPAKPISGQKVSQAVAVTTSMPTPKVASENGAVSVSQVQAVWSDLISHIKKGNPVASTFLRAVNPLEVAGNVVILQVSYPLHRTFFEKPENKVMVESLLHELLKVKVSIKCQMDPNIPTGPKPRQAVSQPEISDNSLYQNVKEVFGAA